jgi:hypothetical protein
MIDIKVGADGDKNCHITLSGQMEQNSAAPASVLVFGKLKGAPKAMRIDGIQFAVQEKMGFNLWWIMPPEGSIPHYSLIMPVESRGGFDFEKIKPISSPSGATGIALTWFKVTEKGMSFMIMLDLTKQ